MGAVKTENNQGLLFVFASTSVNMEKNKVSTKQQLDRLVDLVRKNPSIGRGKRISGTGRDEIKKAWESYAVELNRLGPPTRTAPEWQRVWIHFKANLKRKLARTRENFEANGSSLGAFHEISLSATEEKVFEITQMDFSPTTNEFNDMSDERIKTPSPPPPAAESWLIPENTDQPTTTKHAKTTVAQLELLEGMAAKQNEMLHTLKKMQSTQHKLYQLKLEKLKLLKKREREASTLRNLRMELAKAKLMQIKK